MAQILDGKALAAQVRAQLETRVAALKARGVTPGLVVIRVGDDPASEVYVRNKERMCQKLGFLSEVVPSVIRWGIPPVSRIRNRALASSWLAE